MCSYPWLFISDRDARFRLAGQLETITAHTSASGRSSTQRMALGAITQGVLLGMSELLAIPSLMVFLSLVLPPQVNRWTNIILGIMYTLVMILAIKGAWHFYVFLD